MSKWLIGQFQNVVLAVGEKCKCWKGKNGEETEPGLYGSRTETKVKVDLNKANIGSKCVGITKVV
jgi:hypothetical protein